MTEQQQSSNYAVAIAVPPPETFLLDSESNDQKHNIQQYHQPQQLIQSTQQQPHQHTQQYTQQQQHTNHIQYPDLNAEFARIYMFSVKKCFKNYIIFHLIKNNKGNWIFCKNDLPNKKYELNIQTHKEMFNVLIKFGIKNYRYDILLRDNDGHKLSHVKLETLEECLNWCFATETTMNKVSVLTIKKI